MRPLFSRWHVPSSGTQLTFHSPLFRPAFLPDPNDGSLYILGGKNKEGLMVSSAAGGCLHPTRPSLLSRGWAGQARGVRWLLLALVTLAVSA